MNVARILLLLTLALSLCGCAGSYFQVSPDEYRRSVQRLGVVPLLVDEGSTIAHPERAAVIEVLQRAVAGREGALIERLREQGGYAGVVPLAAPAARLAGLIDGAATVKEGDAVFRRYRTNPARVAELCREAGVDALLLVVLGGVERSEKRWDRLNLNYLHGPGNVVLGSALVVASSGTVLWEYPGSGASFLDLQFAAFDEAWHNRSEQVEVRYVTPAGLARILAEPDRTAFGGSDFPKRIRVLFDTIAESLRPGLRFGAPVTPSP